MIIFYSIILGFVVVVMLVMTFYTVATLIGVIRAKGVPFVPLTRKQIAYLNESVKLKPDDKVVDLGCGEGRVLRLFEKQGVKVLDGYEVNLWACFLAKVKNKIYKSKTKIFHQNFNKINLEKYNIVFCYLLEEYLVRLRDKFDKELKPGTKVICFSFKIKDWREPVKIIKNEKHKIFIYQI